MKLWAAPQQPLPWAAAFTRWATNSPVAASGLALVLVALVATLDQATGYELRFAILYLVPIALATWAGGLRAGVAIVAVSSLFWLVSFGSTHPYKGDFFFYWEGVAMVVIDIAFVLLLARLRFALTRADERFVRVLEELHAAVYVADQDSGRILYANRSLARMIDTDPRTLSAEDLGKRFGLGEVTTESVLGEHKELIDAEFVSREVRDPMSGRWYQVQVVPIPWKSSRSVSVQVITDISEKKRAKALKQQHQDMLHQTARLAALAEIATSLAHEVNQPLMAIASYNDACLRLLAAPVFDKAQVVTALQRSREQALRAGRIIGRVRDFIRSKRPSPTHFDINALVRESLELLENQLEDSAVTAELSLSEGLPMTHADRTLLIQVIVNLVQNAIDAMDKSPPSSRRLGVSTAKAADGAIVVSIADQGEGIPEAISVRLYTPLFSTKSHGLGLGLSICRSVLEAHGGRIWHSTNPDGGCTFHFTLPPEID
ncbi:sensor histidine kinase [Propionivibrio sp.]|uniref:sensor histidine kinase n=1 Tax=Propionivibrio sp. TaxID=2212460 RepID=UPI003BF452F6